MPRKTDSRNPGDWLLIVEDELGFLRPSVEAGQYPEICRARLAEALEKTMKAELIRLGWPLRKTHELEVLADELRARGSDLLPVIEPLAADFVDAYFTGRYPGFDLEDPDWPTLRAQLAAITSLAATIRSRLPQPSP